MAVAVTFICGGHARLQIRVGEEERTHSQIRDTHPFLLLPQAPPSTQSQTQCTAVLQAHVMAECRMTSVYLELKLTHSAEDMSGSSAPGALSSTQQISTELLLCVRHWAATMAGQGGMPAPPALMT